MEDALNRATVAFARYGIDGGYAWAWSLDSQHRLAETALGPTEVAVQPPGTPAIGETWLRAYRVTGNSVFLGHARAAGHALAKGQLPAGGWDYVIELRPEERRGNSRELAEQRGQVRVAPRKIVFDDDTTQSAVRFLLRLTHATSTAPEPQDVALRAALERALTALVQAQYPNGAWPQRWDGSTHAPAADPSLHARIPSTYPRQYPRVPYAHHYTLNDGAHRDLLLTLALAVRHSPRKDLRTALARGIQFLRLAQLPAPQAGWAQQYNAAMEPTWARAFEPPAVSSAETGQVVALLVDLYLENGDATLLDPVPAALAWLKRARLPSGDWARLYELGTDAPLYGDRDGKLHATLEEISPERQLGYRWRGDFDLPEIIARAEAVLTNGRTAWLGAHPGWSLLGEKAPRHSSKLTARAAAAVASLDAEGRWLSEPRGRRAELHPGPWVESAVFNRQMRVLCDWLEAARWAAVTAPDKTR